MTNDNDLGETLLDQYTFQDRYRVPLMSQPPAVGESFDPDAWKCAMGFDGLSRGADVEERRVRVYVGATRTHLCLAVVSALHPEGGMLAGDALEILVNPSPSDAEQVCQITLGGDGQLQFSNPAVSQDQLKDLCRVVSFVERSQWHCQAILPSRAFGRQETTGGEWSLNVRRVFERPPVRVSLGNDESSDVIFRFTEDPCPAVQWRHDRPPSSGDIRTGLTLYNPSCVPLELKAEVLLRRPKRPDQAQEAALRLLPGQSHEVFLKVEAVACQNFELFAGVLGAGGEFLYTRYGKYDRGRGAWWEPMKVEVLPIDFRFAYYPYYNQMKVRADVRGLPKEARLESLDFRIQPKGGGAAVKELKIEARQFVQGLCETEFDLPPLEGDYEVVASARGENVPTEKRVKTFQRKRFEWEHGSLGLSRKVYPPFVPIAVEGRTLRTVLKEYRLNDLGLLESIRTEQSEGLDVQEVLAGEMRYTSRVDGRTEQPQEASCRVETAQDDQVVARSRFRLGAIRAEAISTLDYDGMLRVDLTLQPAPGVRLESLDLEIPLSGRVARMVHAVSGRYRDAVEFRDLPQGQGVIWSAADLPPCGWEENFCNYIFLGDPARGLCWFVENDRGWSRTTGAPNLHVLREDGQVKLRVHLVDRALEIDAPRTITFGLQAAPVKPRLPGWRHRWYTDRFSVLGCDCHWFSLGNYGSFYPAGGDLSLWEAIRRGNTEHLSDRQIEAIIDNGRKNFEPYGRPWVRSFENVARMDLRNRYGTRMIFYYNRDSYVGSEEFQTFMDEWGVDEYNDRFRGLNSPGPVGAIPTRSHLDFILHWYGKSFEVAGNTGVYMDNLFFRAFRNLKTSGAYRRPDGSMVPSNGIWELREQAKRTFVFLNERGMEPIHMGHMTSLELLPVLSFYTIQYDWEWQRGRGDVHDRFTRPYLQLVSCGELSGNWPIVLHELGGQQENMFQRFDWSDLRRILDETAAKAEDPWVLKTFLGVTIVHELLVDPYRWHYEPIPQGDTPENRLFNTFRKPILDFVRQGPCEVYRYWDDRPQPVTAGDDDLPTIVYSRRGSEALAAITSYADGPRQVELKIDPAALGLAGGYKVIDIETGKELAHHGDRVGFELARHDLKEFRLLPA